MKEQNGFIYLHRKILNNQYLNDKPFCRGYAWNVLLLLTNRKVGYIDVKNGQQIKLMRGDCGYSQKALADIFGWSRGKVKRFLNELEKRKMIQQKIVANHTIIKVLKFNIYQNRQQTDIQIEQQKNTKIEQQKNTKNNDYIYISKSELEKMIQQKMQKTDTETDTNNNNTIYSNNINTHTKEKNNVCVLPKISKEEREILKNYARKSKATNITAYVHTLIANGGYLEILEQEKAKAEKKKQKEISAAAEKIEEVQEDEKTTKAAYEKFKKAGAELKKLKK